MFGKINTETDEFTSTIKDIEGCDKLIDYMGISIYSSIKLLMFASKSFSLIVRVLMFFIISITGLIMLASVGAMPFNITNLIAVDLLIFAFTLIFVVRSKRILVSSVLRTKEKMEEVKSSEE